MELFDLKGKVALVTGSTKGIGKAIVTRMAEHGAKVVVSSRKADACDEVAAEINAKYPGQAIAIPCNIADKAQLQNLVDKTNEAFGKIDVLVCNAAVNPYFGPSKDIPDEAFDRIMSSNVKSNHWLCHMVLPQMQERKDGSIIIISSIGGLHGSSIIGAYCISKAADFQLARNLSVEFGRSGYPETIHRLRAPKAHRPAGRDCRRRRFPCLESRGLHDRPANGDRWRGHDFLTPPAPPAAPRLAQLKQG